MWLLLSIGQVNIRYIIGRSLLGQEWIYNGLYGYAYTRNQLTIGIWLGSGIELGIGIDTQPVNAVAVTTKRIARIAILGPFLNFEDSPINLYDMAQNQGFCQAFPGVS